LNSEQREYEKQILRAGAEIAANDKEVNNKIRLSPKAELLDKLYDQRAKQYKTIQECEQTIRDLDEFEKIINLLPEGCHEVLNRRISFDSILYFKGVTFENLR
jgi:hypothetical protein